VEAKKDLVMSALASVEDPIGASVEEPTDRQQVATDVLLLVREVLVAGDSLHGLCYRGAGLDTENVLGKIEIASLAILDTCPRAVIFCDR